MIDKDYERSKIDFKEQLKVKQQCTPAFLQQQDLKMKFLQLIDNCKQVCIDSLSLAYYYCCEEWFDQSIKHLDDITNDGLVAACLNMIDQQLKRSRLEMEIDRLDIECINLKRLYTTIDDDSQRDSIYDLYLESFDTVAKTRGSRYDQLRLLVVSVDSVLPLFYEMLQEVKTFEDYNYNLYHIVDSLVESWRYKPSIVDILTHKCKLGIILVINKLKRKLKLIGMNKYMNIKKTCKRLEHILQSDKVEAFQTACKITQLFIIPDVCWQHVYCFMGEVIPLYAPNKLSIKESLYAQPPPKEPLHSPVYDTTFALSFQPTLSTDSEGFSLFDD